MTNFMAEFIILVILTITVLNVEASNECGACEQLVINKIGDRKCVRQPQCCEQHGIQLTCLVNPCTNYNTACPRAKHCVPVYCEEIGCTAFYYDDFYNLIPGGECEVKVLKIGDDELDGIVSRARRYVSSFFGI
ncbi:unnamed protein product [Bursaphelenchus okinawaensis]|uniref:Uncharacterized protein n=1 Tax=Bursaphelenchus okinawaensis TaxID=465554 RepID=A0A811L239_9BILA|nr:unnamed protein product [Bursaphelenchus okinawaensis]CAG9117296.1 unnamed protein product [Bursaphelenchus okinawaensis]